MISDSESWDLYKLFIVVKEKGGYDAVCKNRLWDLVGEAYGLGVNVGSSVELVYTKHFSSQEECLKNVAHGKFPECGLVNDRDRVEFRKRLMEVQAESLSNDYGEEEAGDESGKACDSLEGRKLCGTNLVEGVNSEFNGAEKDHSDGLVDLDMPAHGMDELIPGNSCNTARDILEVFGQNKIVTLDASDAESNIPTLSSGSKSCDNDDDNNSDEVLILDPSDVDKESFGRKRKRESKLEMLSWVTSIAKNPCDPAVCSMPEKSKWKSYGSQEIWKQILLFREAVFLKKDSETLREQFSWQGQKMHPSMYDDPDRVGAIYNLRQRLTCDKKLFLEKSTSDQVLHIPVGPNHQAEVSKWTGMTYESDFKWLGTQIWPPEALNSKQLLFERDPVGKGRQDSCGCPVQGSVECVWFHVSMKRSKVKLELGEAFYRWNLHKVGEEVRGSWTLQEEKKFKDVVKSNPTSLDTCYWDYLFKTFPKKSREDLVSYYFNVFLLQRRAYQNRHTPDNIDSDDDESEFTPLKKVFGHQTQNSRSFTLLSPQKATNKGRR